VTTVYGNPAVHLRCDLCFREGIDVHTGLACFRDDGRFERIDRCDDHQACRDRLEATGAEWPLSDITTRRVAR
jgi:hypothetical protein